MHLSRFAGAGAAVMKVVALVSGGKDSCYNMMLCERYGHEVVALANLLPKDEGVDDLDSHMFQTVGHQFIQTYAQCMGLPLYRRKIQGSSVGRSLIYDINKDDEVEDMLLLLAYVKDQIPDVGAVSSGAIASDYQRLRVEHVCSRLGLVSLSYLWRMPQVKLFDDMMEAKVHALLVKVASLGLDPQKHLGKSLNEMRDHLLSLREKFDGNMCGEGGEYETLVLDCPLFKYGKIVLDDYTAVATSLDTIAPSGVLQPKAFHVETKVPMGEKAIVGEVIEVTGDVLPGTDVVQPGPVGQEGGIESCRASAQTHLHKSDCYTHIISEGFIDTNANPPGTDASAPEDVKACMQSMLDSVKSVLDASKLLWSNCIFVELYLADMELFSDANSVYCKFFPLVSPPARACVELPLPPGVLCRIDVLAYSQPKVVDGRPRQVLHVQSISQWAPCCIGPYGQATSCGAVVHTAGQLGFVSPTMQLVPGGISAEYRQALDHCQSVAVVMGSDITRVAIGLVTYISMKHAKSPNYAPELSDYLSKFAPHTLWWDGKEDDSYSVEESHDPHLDAYLIPPSISGGIPPLLMYIGVPALPKNAAIEVQPMTLDARKVHIWDASDSDDPIDSTPVTGSSVDNIDVILSDKLGLSYWEKFRIKIEGETDILGRFVSVTTMASRLNLWISQENSNVSADYLGHAIFRGIHYFIDQCQLSWVDVCACRFVFVSNRTDFMHEIFRVVNGNAQEAGFGKLDGVFVPALGVGVTPAMKDFALVDILAGGGWGRSSVASNVI